MYKLDHPADLSQFESIKRRQRLDKERMQRIFDPKTRVIGLDVKGIEEQTRIKNELRELDEQRNQNADKESRETNQLLQLLDAKAIACKRALNKEIDRFRIDHQQTCMRRDFDLYDPSAIKNDQHASPTVSGMQTFDGEDISLDARTRAQKNQMQVWTWKAVSQNQEAKLAEKRTKLQHDLRVLQNNHQVQIELENERLHRKQVNMEHAKFNLQLAMEKKLNEAQHKRSETEMNREEIQRNVTGDFLTERPAPPQAFPHLLRIDAFKGMTPAQIKDIQTTRSNQILEARQLAEKQKQDDKQWDKHRLAASRATALMDREMKRVQQHRDLEVMLSNQEMAHEFKQRQSFLDKVVYTNPPTEQFFQQFNTTSR